MPTYEFHIYHEVGKRTTHLIHDHTIHATADNRLLAEESLNLGEGEYPVWFGRIIDNKRENIQMEHFEAQVILQFPLDLASNNTNLSEAIHEARKTAEAIADSTKAIIVKTTIIHYPSGSGEPIFIDE